ncbi:hypothetical protein YPPY11_0209, partial [Yersinia pestis PY-11]
MNEAEVIDKVPA